MNGERLGQDTKYAKGRRQSRKAGPMLVKTSGIFPELSVSTLARWSKQKNECENLQGIRLHYSGSKNLQIQRKLEGGWPPDSFGEP